MSDQLTDIELAEILARCAAATPGPWEQRSQSNTADARTEDFVLIQGVRMFGRYQDCAFIAHSRSDLPRAAAELKEARRDLREWQDYWGRDSPHDTP